MITVNKNERYTGKSGDIIAFSIGATTNTFGRSDIRVFLKEVTLKVADDGQLVELDGSPLDLRKYTIEVTPEAFKDYLEHFEFSPLTKIFNMPLKDFFHHLSRRQISQLNSNNIITVRDIVTKKYADMIKMKGIGRKTLNWINFELSIYNLSIGMDLTEYEGLLRAF